MTDRTEQLHRIARTYVECLGAGDFEAIPYAEDVELRAPLCPGGSAVPLNGRTNLKEVWWAPLPDLVSGVEVVDTYINGDATGSSKVNGGSGSGLLYVNGDLEIAADFQWRGLIYVEGDLRITGTPWIIGGVVARGSTQWAFSGGNPGILYSHDTIRLAMESAFSFVILSWKEM